MSDIFEAEAINQTKKEIHYPTGMNNVFAPVTINNMNTRNINILQSKFKNWAKNKLNKSTNNEIDDGSQDAAISFEDDAIVIFQANDDNTPYLHTVKILKYDEINTLESENAPDKLIMYIKTKLANYQVKINKAQFNNYAALQQAFEKLFHIANDKVNIKNELDDHNQ